MNRRTSDLPTSWGNVTDPNKHRASDASFRYLVHGFWPKSMEEWLSGRDEVAESLIKLDELYANNPKYGPNDPALGDQSINLREKPEEVNGRVVLRMSLIDPWHTKTWGDAGLIVQVPEEDVLLTHTRDASTFSNVAKLREEAAAEPPVSPDKLLSLTSPETYNEVVALAGRATLCGFFCNYDANPEYMSDYALSEPDIVGLDMKHHARRLDLPFIILPAQPRRFQTNN